MAKVQNLCKAGNKYQGSDGVERTSWHIVGKLVTKDDGKQFIELFMQPGELINVFDQKPKNASQSAPQSVDVDSEAF